MAMRVMIVDDSATIRQQVSSVLTAEGFEIVEAVDGQDALSKVSASGGFSLIICDVQMPRMNGLEMLEKLKAEPRNASVPVIILTTEGQPDVIARGKALGARAWMVKPFKPQLLVSAVKKLAVA